MTFSRFILLSCFCALPLGCGKPEDPASLLRSGEEYYAEEKYEQAKIQFMKVLRVDQRNSVALGALGQIWSEQGAPVQALPYLLSCLKEDPSDLGARIALAEIMLITGNQAGAHGEALEVLKHEEDHERALAIFADTAVTAEQREAVRAHLSGLGAGENAARSAALGALALRENDGTAAATHLDEALLLNPGSPDYHNLRATLYFVEGKPEDAVAMLKKAAELASPRSVIRLRYIRFLLRNGEADVAEASLNSLVERARDFLPAWRLLAEIALSRNEFERARTCLNNVFGPNPQDLEGHLIDARIFLVQGESEKALEKLKSLRLGVPENSILEYEMARAYLLSANPSLAGAALDRAVKLNPEFNAALILRARLDLRQGKVDDVLSAMESYLLRHPKDFQAQLLLADGYRAAGRLEDAGRVLASGMEEGIQNPQAHLFLGIVHRQLGRDEEARSQFERAQELDPDNLLATYQLADLDLRKEDVASAVNRVRAQLERNPDSAAAHFLHAQVLMAQEDWEHAEEALLHVIELKADFLAAYQDLSRVLRWTGKLERAVAELERYRATNPDNVAILMQQGTIYQELGLTDKAKKAYERILKLDQKFAPALNNLAWIASERGDLDQALELGLQARDLPLPERSAASVADTLGRIYYRKEEWSQAFRLLQEAAGILTDQPSVQAHFGMAASMMGQAELARAAFEEALASEEQFDEREEVKRRLADVEGGATDLDTLMERRKRMPKDLLVGLQYAKALEVAGRYDEALATYNQILEINPDLVQSLMSAATLCLERLDRPEEALRHAKAARALSQSDRSVAGLLGKVAFQAKDYPWALSLLSEGVVGGSEDFEQYSLLARAYYTQGRIGEAREAMEKALAAPAPSADDRTFLALTEPSPADPVGRLALARELLAQGKREVPALMVVAAADAEVGKRSSAEALYQEVLAEYEEFAPATRGLALLYLSDPGRHEEAERLATKARETLRDDPELASALAKLSYEKGKYAYVLGLLNEVKAKRMLTADEQCYRGMSEADLGKVALAKANLEEAIARGLPPELSDLATKRLKELGGKE